MYTATSDLTLPRGGGGRGRRIAFEKKAYAVGHAFMNSFRAGLVSTRAGHLKSDLSDLSDGRLDCELAFTRACAIPECTASGSLRLEGGGPNSVVLHALDPLGHPPYGYMWPTGNYEIDGSALFPLVLCRYILPQTDLVVGRKRLSSPSSLSRMTPRTRGRKEPRHFEGGIAVLSSKAPCVDVHSEQTG
jgi:hypothetical protein